MVDGSECMIYIIYIMMPYRYDQQYLHPLEFGIVCIYMGILYVSALISVCFVSKQLDIYTTLLYLYNKCLLIRQAKNAVIQTSSAPCLTSLWIEYNCAITQPLI
jgi:hypothetical protein